MKESARLILILFKIFLKNFLSTNSFPQIITTSKDKIHDGLIADVRDECEKNARNSHLFFYNNYSERRCHCRKEKIQDQSYVEFSVFFEYIFSHKTLMSVLRYCHTFFFAETKGQRYTSRRPTRNFCCRISCFVSGRRGKKGEQPGEIREEVREETLAKHFA